MARKKLLFLYNPSAGRAQSSRSLDFAAQQACRAGYEMTVYPIMEGLDAETVLAQAEQQYDLVICSGGDGTLHHTVNGLMQLPDVPRIGYIPTGSTNDFASSLSLPKNAEEAISAILSGSEHFIDIGKFGDELFCYVAAFGAFSAVSYETPQNMKNAMGHLAYIIEGMKNLPIGQKYPARIEANGTVYEDDFLFCSISNTTYIGGFPLDKSVDASLDDGQFEVLLIKAPESVAEANLIIAQLLSKDFDTDLIHLLHTDSLTVHFPEPTAWSLDGEFGGEQTDVSVSVLHHALRIMF